MYRPNAGGESLGNMLGKGLSKPQQALFDLLFMNDKEEQHLQLDEGYRGRAHVGSAAFLAALASGPNKLFDSIQRIAEKSNGAKINVFFIGSAFGGTGAAGFPTLARNLHRMRRDRAFPNAQNIRIGGLLMLPYFNFNAPEKEEQAVVTADELLPKTKLALEYYHNLRQHERSFDLFYTLGWPEQYPLGYHEPGANEQANPALPTEMLGASAAIHFFRRMNDYADTQETVSFLSAHDDDWIDWRDVPNDAPAENEAMRKLGQLLRFAAYWKYAFEPELSKPVRGLLGGGRNRAQKLADKAHPADHQEEIEVLGELLTSILNWFATIDATADRVSGGQRMWSTDQINDQRYEGVPTRPVQVAGAIYEDYWEQAFDSLVIKGESGIGGRSASAIFAELTAASAPARHAGMGKALVQVYEACRLYEEGA